MTPALLLRAAAAAGLAFFLSLVAQLLLLGAIGGEGAFPVVAVLGAPVTEEAAKLLGRLLMRLPWVPVGLGFGIIEAGFKLAQYGAVLGALASLLLHWGLACVAERRGILWAIPLHALFNGLVVGVEAAGGPDEAFAAGLALLVLLGARRIAGPMVDAGRPGP